MVAKEILYPRQRIPLYAFAAVILTVVFRLQLIQGVHVLLIDNLPHPLLFSELHKALQRLAEPLPGDGFEDVVERAVADRQATGIHIAGGGDKDDRTVGTCQHRIADKRNPFPVRQVIIQQHQLRSLTLNLRLRVSQR